MTTPAEVVAAAMDMTSGSRLERGRAGVRAFGLFSQLSAADKRDLAVLVAQRVAPELVPRIQAEGGVDLTEEQSRAVLDMVRRLDGSDLLELQQAVATSDARRDAASSVGAAAAAATGLDDVVGEQPRPAATPDPGRTPPVLDEAAEREAIRLEALQRQCDDLREQLADEEAAHREAANEREHAERELEDVRRQLADQAERADREARAAEDARAETRAVEQRLRHVRDRAAARTSTAPGTRTASPGGTGQPIPLPAVPATTTDADVDRLASRLQGVGAGEALRVLTAAAPAVAGMAAEDRRRMLQALPDGWARQRGLQRLVEAHAVPAAEAPTLLGLLAAPGSQVFAAGSMLATGLVTTDALVEVLDPSALARLRRRGVHA